MMLPHTPKDGPPLPKGWSPTWNELSQLAVQVGEEKLEET
jgi:hypothetical protein